MNAGLRAAIHAGGSDSPELEQVHVGFLPLTDCASLIMASELGLDRKHGVRIVPCREASWAGLRDKLLNGELDLAQALYGMVCATHLGLGGAATPMAVLMTLNQNGQAITLSGALASQGACDGASLARLMHSVPRDNRFAQTFPTGTHALWLNYWLAAHGIDPLRDASSFSLPPSQMVAHMRQGHIDGFCAGEPWNHRAILDGLGITAASSQQIWPDHPEKVLAATDAFVTRYPSTARAVSAAVLEASRWIDASAENRSRMADTIARATYVNTSVDAIRERILGHYQDGLGRRWDDAHSLKFFDDGSVNFPYLSDCMWFLTQHWRWGFLAEHPDYLAVARQINRSALYRDAAQAAGVAMPASEMRSSVLMDGRVWDGSDPRGYAEGFAISAASAAVQGV